MTQMAAIDPMCGMSVEEADAPAKVDHDGTTYYFRSVHNGSVRKQLRYIFNVERREGCQRRTWGG